MCNFTVRPADIYVVLRVTDLILGKQHCRLYCNTLQHAFMTKVLYFKIVLAPLRNVT